MEDSRPTPDETAEALEPLSAEAAAVLVENHRRFLSFLERRVGDRATAEDILQEAFARGLDRLEKVRDPDSIVAWFYRALRNAVIDHYRRRGASQRALEAFAAEMQAQEQPGEELERELCQCVLRLSRTLKPEYARALARIDVEDVPVKAFAEEQGISASNAAVRAFRAREALRRQVAASCGTCAEHGCVDCTCSSSSETASGPGFD